VQQLDLAQSAFLAGIAARTDALFSLQVEQNINLTRNKLSASLPMVANGYKRKKKPNSGMQIRSIPNFS